MCDTVPESVEVDLVDHIIRISSTGVSRDEAPIPFASTLTEQQLFFPSVSTERNDHKATSLVIRAIASGAPRHLEASGFSFIARLLPRHDILVCDVDEAVDTSEVSIRIRRATGSAERS